ncbi:MAG: EAL domain-containing protein [Pseudomonadota bacterium]
MRGVKGVNGASAQDGWTALGRNVSEATVSERDQHAGGVPARVNEAAQRRPVQEAMDLISRLVDAMELTPMVAVHSMDAQGIVHFWNDSCTQLYGIPGARALGQPLASLLTFERQAEHDAALEMVRQTGQPSPAHDWQVVSAAGKTLWIYSTMFPVMQSGEVQQIFCMDVDISARKLEEQALLEAGANFRQMYLKSADAILLLKGEQIVEANPAALHLFKCGDKHALVGRRLGDFSPLQQPSGAASSSTEQQATRQAHAEGNCRYEWRYLNCAGELFWAEVLMTSITLDHEYLFYVVVRDISARKQAERSLHLAAQVFENSRDAILLTDRNQRIIAINRAYTAITGHPSDEMLGKPLNVYRSGIEDDAFYHQVWSEIVATGHWQGEIWSRRKNGEVFPAWLSLAAIRDNNNAVSNYMGILSDITDRKKSEEHTKHLAEHDFLTDLPNRVLLLDRLSLALTAARRNHKMLAILFLDLDRFKHVNDTLGHQVGDALLKEVAARLIKCVRGVDTVSRQGGDEFLIILADIGGIDQAAHVAGSILQAIAQPFVLGQNSLSVSTSIGVAIYPNDGSDIDQLIKHADIAMYHAKENGRNSFQFFNADMHMQIVERVTFENGLRLALRNQEFELEFQAEIDARSGAPVGMEALIRWRHPQLGLLRPERFITVAEECGLMIPIGNWVLQQACRQARRWHDAGYAIMVAVNLSVAQFTQKNLLQSVDEALESSGLPAASLELELTEALIMKGGAGANDTLQALRTMGVRLTIDDFGTGYSRLSHLKDYPIDKLKIDQSFMAGITGKPDDGAIVSAIIAMARSLKLQVVAEGVETPEQLQFLRSQGCDQYQGYLADAQAPASALRRLLH